MSTHTPHTPSSDSTPQLKSILTRPPPLELLPPDLNLILSSFRSPQPQPRTISLAILVRFLTPTPTSSTLRNLRDAVQHRLSGTDSSELVEAIAGLTAALQVAPSLAVGFLKDDVMRSYLEDAVVLISSGAPRATGKAEGQRREERRALVELLSLAAGQSGVRAMIRTSAGPWLESLLGHPTKGGGTDDGRVRALAGVGVVKLRLGTEKPEEGEPQPEGGVQEEKVESVWKLEALVKMLAGLVVQAGGKDSAEEDAAAVAEREGVLLPALEGLAYLTLVPEPKLKQLVISSQNFLDTFFTILGPAPAASAPVAPATAGSLDYAVASLLANLATFPPPEDAQSDAAQMARLKAFAAAKNKKQPGQPAPELPKAESTESITSRIRALVEHKPSPMGLVGRLCQSTSVATRRLVGKVLLGFVTPQSLRGQLLQEGAGKMLLGLARQLPAPFSAKDDLDTIQAMAKLLITTNPVLVYGPTPASPQLLEAVGAVALPLGVADDVGLIVKFECLMALTNISSLDGELAGRIAGSKVGKIGASRDGGKPMLAVIEELMLGENLMVRRAATELMCNLACSQAGWDFYQPAPLPPKPAPDQTDTQPNSHLHLLLALSSSDDLPTRLAASGALTSIAMSPPIGFALALYGRALEILVELIRSEPKVEGNGKEGLQARGLDVLRSVGEAVRDWQVEEWRRVAKGVGRRAGVAEALVDVAKSEVDGDVKAVAKEALDIWTALSLQV